MVVLAVVANGCDRPEILEHRPVTVNVTELLYSDAPAWSALTADLDGDGVDELILAGHRSVKGPGYCRLAGRYPCAWHSFLGRAADRHHCTAGDVDADGDFDLYCTSGAGRGTSVGPNEVWRQVAPLQFESVPDALGASESTSRGRLSAFLDFNGDAYPDLVTTAWGQRDDGADNRSKLWINREGRLIPAALGLPVGFGARCLSIADVNADGYDDLIGCPTATGLSALLNREGVALKSVSLGSEKDWYWDVQFVPAGPDSAPLLVSTGGWRGAMFVEITHLTMPLDSAASNTTAPRRIPCRQGDLDGEDPELYCGRLLIHDADGDGHVDILVSRHRGWRHEVVLGDAPDLLIYGPAFREFSDLPTAPEGAGARLLASRIGIVQVNAGKDWPGSVRLITLGRLATRPAGVQSAPAAGTAPRR